MNIDRMRRIDRWAGVPLCFLATLAIRLAPSRRTLPPRNALLVELSEMGSVVLADPAMRKLRRLTGCALHFVIFESNRASLDLLRTVAPENVFAIRSDSFLGLAADSLRFLLWARRRRIDLAIDLELFSRYSALLTGLSGAGTRAGFDRFHAEGLYRGDLLTHRVAYNPHIHIAKNFVALVNAVTASAAERPYSKTRIGDDEIRIEPPPPPHAALARIGRLLAEPGIAAADGRVVLVNPNAGDMLPHRRWPDDHVIALVRLALERWPDIRVLLTGTAAEAEHSVALCRAVGGPRCASLAGRLDLAELPALYARAVLMVTNDSGPGHFAAAAGLPAIVLFGPETPALYGPLGPGIALTAGLACSPCVSAANHRRTACDDPVCMRAIEPEVVLRAMAVWLGDGHRGVEPAGREPQRDRRADADMAGDLETAAMQLDQVLGER